MVFLLIECVFNANAEASEAISMILETTFILDLCQSLLDH